MTHRFKACNMFLSLIIFFVFILFYFFEHGCVFYNFCDGERRERKIGEERERTKWYFEDCCYDWLKLLKIADVYLIYYALLLNGVIMTISIYHSLSDLSLLYWFNGSYQYYIMWLVDFIKEMWYINSVIFIFRKEQIRHLMKYMLWCNQKRLLC